jgi:hypothetical protein
MSCHHTGCTEVDMVPLIEGNLIGDNRYSELVEENMGKLRKESGFDHTAS